MKSDFEILEEYLKNDSFYNRLTPQEKLLDKMVVRDSLDFQRYLLKARIKELAETIIKRRSK